MIERKCGKCGFISLLKASGESSAREERFLECHLSACSRCSKESGELGKLPGLPDMDVSGQVLAAIKIRSAEALGAAAGNSTRSRLLKPAFAIFAAAAAVFAAVYFRAPEQAFYVPFPDDSYRAIDERLLSAENTLQAISLEIIYGIDDF